MIIENGGFTGSVIPDQMQGIREGEKSEYAEVMQNVQKSILAFCNRKWEDGYVGICDCDIAICRNSQGRLYAKILEYNYNRETGGTASYHLWQRMGNGNGVVIARDSIKGPGLAYSIPALQKRMGSTQLEYGNSGAIILGHRLDAENNSGKIMSLVYGKSFEEALQYDKALRDLAN
jgi:hypothetical protein